MNDKDATDLVHRHRLKLAALRALQKREDERQARELQEKSHDHPRTP